MNVVVLGRSGIMLRAARELESAGVTVVGVITAEPYAEYEVGPAEYADFAEEVGARFATATTSAQIEALGFHTTAGDTPVLVSCNWRYKLTESLLNRWSSGVVNLHLGNLPDYKGNATVNWSILDGLDHIYANVHRMVVELDAGDVLARHKIEITENTYVGDVLSEAEAAAGPLFLEALKALRDGSPPLVIGSMQGLRCFPRLPEDGRIDWSQNAGAVHRLIRASSHPYPGAFSWIGQKRVQVWRARPAEDHLNVRAVPGHIIHVDRSTGSVVAACGAGSIEITEVSVDGSPMRPADVVRGIRARFSNELDSTVPTSAPPTTTLPMGAR